jgi:two-component system response regulator PilR (NtrC family)
LPALCAALVQRIAAESGQPAPSLSPQTLAQLACLPLQGNVRELENLLHRAIALSEGGELKLDMHAAAPSQAEQLSADTLAPATSGATVEALPADLQTHLDQQEREILVRTLKETGFNRTLAANRLGLSLRQIRYRIARLKIDAPQSPEDEPDA